MLKTYLNTLPYTKFVLIEDSLEERGKNILEYLVNNHINRRENRVNYFVFEGLYMRTKQKYATSGNFLLHDFVSNSCNWLDEPKIESFDAVASKMGSNDVVVIDSLSNVISRYGLAETYRIFSRLKNNQGVQQIISVLHKDLLEQNAKVQQYFECLSTLFMNLQPKISSDDNRVSYVYKKSGGKVITQIERYKFDENKFLTEKIEKPDPKKLIEEAKPKEIDPETLSTFRIGLTDEEKVSRDKVVLPYLPKAENDKQSAEEGKIFYQFDDVDDWDEEDPDDDLDI